MQQNLREEIPLYMGAFAEELLTDSTYRLISTMLPPLGLGQIEPNAYALASIVVGVAHGTELLIKSAIASVHPLLLFDRLYQRLVPAPEEQLLGLTHLLREETIPFARLPAALWQAVDMRVPGGALFDEFRSLRNQIQHFHIPPGVRLRDITLRFLFEIVDPLLRRFRESDLLDLVRPHGVRVLESEVRRLVPGYEWPAWIAVYEENEEQKPFVELEMMRRRQQELAATAAVTLTQYLVHMTLIVPASRVARANTEAVRLLGNLPDRFTFRVPLSPSGRPPVTHYGAHAAATEDMATRFMKLIRRNQGHWEYSCTHVGSTAEETRRSFVQTCAHLGLQRVARPDGGDEVPS